MKLEEQVCSLELAKKLKELGVKQESLFYWDIKWNNVLVQKDGFETNYKDRPRDMISAFTVAELGEMLPKFIETKKLTGRLYICPQNKNGWAVCYIFNWDKAFNLHDENIIKFADTEADARAKMLIYLLENKLITL